MQKDTFCVLCFACDRCWSCCACLSIFISKGTVDMLCNQSRGAWWSTKEKKEKQTKTKHQQQSRKHQQQNRLSWIQNEEHFIFLLLPLFCLGMRCVSMKSYFLNSTIYAMKPSGKLLQVPFPRPRCSNEKNEKKKREREREREFDF